MSDNVIEEENIPTEYDAIRKSKIVANELCEKSEVERYIQRKILELEGTKYFWIKFNSIKTNDVYDWKEQVLKLWNHHKIEDEMTLIKKANRLNRDQAKIIEMYDFAYS